MAPRAPLLLRIWVHELVAVEQCFFQMVGRLRPSSSCGAWMPTLGNPLGRFQILRQVASTMESIEAMAVGDNAIRQCMCMILKLAPYNSRRCFMHGGRGV